MLDHSLKPTLPHSRTLGIVGREEKVQVVVVVVPSAHSNYVLVGVGSRSNHPSNEQRNGLQIEHEIEPDVAPFSNHEYHTSPPSLSPFGKLQKQLLGHDKHAHCVFSLLGSPFLTYNPSPPPPLRDEMRCDRKL